MVFNPCDHVGQLVGCVHLGEHGSTVNRCTRRGDADAHAGTGDASSDPVAFSHVQEVTREVVQRFHDEVGVSVFPALLVAYLVCAYVLRSALRADVTYQGFDRCLVLLPGRAGEDELVNHGVRESVTGHHRLYRLQASDGVNASVIWIVQDGITVLTCHSILSSLYLPSLFKGGRGRK